MQPKGAKKNKLAQAIFSKEGPNLSKPAVTSKPKVTPKIYKVNNKKFKVCTNCVMDTSDNLITFDINGVCDHCQNFNKNIKNNVPKHVQNGRPKNVKKRKNHKIITH